MKPAHSRRVVVAVLCGVAAVVGVLLAQTSPLPRRFGVTLAVAAFLSGAMVGPRGYIPVYIGIASYAFASALSYSPPPVGGDSRSAGVILFLTVIPAYYALPTVAGAIFRRLVLARLQRRI